MPPTVKACEVCPDSTDNSGRWVSVMDWFVGPARYEVASDSCISTRGVETPMVDGSQR